MIYQDKIVDRRIARTQNLIQDALVSLMEEKGFDALSVKDISVRANINRGTFYLHYRDKFDLLDRLEAGIFADIQHIIEKATFSSIEDFKKTDELLPVFEQLFDYINENASIMQTLLGLKGNPAFQTRLKNAIWNNAFEKKFFAHIKEQKLLVPSHYFIAYVASAHLSIIQEWLQKGRQESPKEMALILVNLSFKGPFRAAGIFNG